MALEFILLTHENVNIVAHRIKDNYQTIRLLLLEKLISSQDILYQHLDANSLYFIIYNCINIKNVKMQEYLLDFFFKN